MEHNVPTTISTLLKDMMSSLEKIRSNSKSSKYNNIINDTFNGIVLAYNLYCDELMSEKNFVKYIDNAEEKMLYEIKNYNGIWIDDSFMQAFDYEIRNTLRKIINL